MFLRLYKKKIFCEKYFDQRNVCNPAVQQCKNISFTNCVVCDKLPLDERFILTRSSFYVIKFSYELLLATVQKLQFSQDSVTRPHPERKYSSLYFHDLLTQNHIFIIRIPQFIFSKCILAFQFSTKISNAFLSFLVRLIWFK